MSQSNHHLEITKSVLWCFWGREMIYSDACYTLLLYILYFLSLFSLFSLLTHYSDCLGYCVVVLVIPIFMGIVPIYTTTQSMLLSIFTLIFTNHFIYCSHSANTHNVLCTIFWQCAGGFNPTTWFYDKLPHLFGKWQSATHHYLSLSSQNGKALINSLCLHFLACIR